MVTSRIHIYVSSVVVVMALIMDSVDEARTNSLVPLRLKSSAFLAVYLTIINNNNIEYLLLVIISYCALLLPGAFPLASPSMTWYEITSVQYLRILSYVSFRLLVLPVPGLHNLL